jgi:hypothetical protein
MNAVTQNAYSFTLCAVVKRCSCLNHNSYTAFVGSEYATPLESTSSVHPYPGLFHTRLKFTIYSHKVHKNVTFLTSLSSN